MPLPTILSVTAMGAVAGRIECDSDL